MKKIVYYFKGTKDSNLGKWVRCISVMGMTDEEVCKAMAAKGYEVKKVEYDREKAAK